MKKRTGFVSNSSSSSFVTAWPKKPKTIDAMNTMLFGDSKEYANPYPWEDRPDCFHVDAVSEWLMKYLKWSKKDVRESLVEDLNGEVYCLIRELGEGRTNCSTFVGDKIVSCLVLYRKQAKDYLALLKKRFPRVKWQARFDAAIANRAKWHKLHEAENKKEWDLIKKLRVEHDCPELPWVDTKEMTAEQKAAYEKLRKESWDSYETLVTNDPRCVAQRKRMQSIWRRERENAKTLETIDLAANRLADIFMEDNAGCVFSQIEIHDDSEFGSALEHGDLFSKLPHMKFSHH